MSYDLWSGDSPEPEYPEPTDEDYCQMSGHQSFYDDPESLWSYCYCGQVCTPAHAEPHDEYSAYRANLIDTYLSRLVTLHQSRPYASDPTSLSFETRKNLRHKSPAYLLKLIDSLDRSATMMSSGDWPSLTEEELDSFVTLGMHLNLDGELVLRTMIFRLDGQERYFASEFNDHLPAPYSVLDDGENAVLIQRLFSLYSLLIPEGRSTTWRATVVDVLSRVSPLLQKRPDLIANIASLYNMHGYGAEVTDRVLAMADSAPVHETLVDGFL